MRLILRLLVVAVVGGAAGSALRQYRAADAGEPAEIVLATTTTPIVAGFLAGLLSPKRLRTLVGLAVSGAVAAAIDEDPIDQLTRPTVL